MLRFTSFTDTEFDKGSRRRLGCGGPCGRPLLTAVPPSLGFLAVSAPLGLILSRGWQTWPVFPVGGLVLAEQEGAASHTAPRVSRGGGGP